MNDQDLINQLTTECQSESASIKDSVIERAEKQTVLSDILTLVTRSFCGPFRSLTGSINNKESGEKE